MERLVEINMDKPPLNAEGYLKGSTLTEGDLPDSDVFTGIEDMFGGVTIDTNKEVCRSDEEFYEKLSASLQRYKDQSRRGVWLKISIDNSTFIPLAVKLGFEFHHTFPESIMMTKWLPQDEPNSLPSFATSYIGAGGFVINDKNELLAVCERFTRKKHWKLPGGMVDAQEDIISAVKREVLEETGIETEFVSLICFRQLLNFRFGRSDLYFVCLLKPLSTEIKMDPKELQDAKWMDLDQYIASPLVNSSNQFIAEAYKENFSKIGPQIKPTVIPIFNTEAMFFSVSNPTANKIPRL